MSNIDENNFVELSERVKAGIKKHKIPGAAIAMFCDGKKFYKCFGKTSVENPLPVNTDTLFQVGSITKTLTATAIMMAEQGHIKNCFLDIDKSVKSYLKDFVMQDKLVQENVTTRHLLSHTGGWVGDYFNSFGDGDDALSILVKHISGLPQISPLGKFFSYNNTGFAIASRLLEVACQEPYEKIIQKYIFSPLGLSKSFFYPNDFILTERFAVGHEKRKNKNQVARPWAIGRAGNGLGGAIMSIDNLLTYAMFCLNTDKNLNGFIADKQILDSMKEPIIEAGNRGFVGLSWFIKDIGSVQFFSHGGATNGQQAYLTCVPGHNMAAVILTNADEGGFITDKFKAWIADIWFGQSEALPKPLNPSRRQLESIAGNYHLPLSKFTINLKGEELWLTDIPCGGFPTPDAPAGPPTKPMKIVLLDGDKLEIVSGHRAGTQADILRGDDGQVQYIRFGARIHPRT